MLSDFEYRVWNQYLLSADDFGVMRATAVKIQADNDALADRPAKAITKALQRLVQIGLVTPFDHQGKSYLCQLDWQTWQKVSYPRGTNEPLPPQDVLAIMDAETRELFAKHPGGNVKRFKERLENIPETFSEDFPPTRAGAPAKRPTANGQRLTADGSEGMPGEPETPFAPERVEPAQPPYPTWFREIQSGYPQKARTGGPLTESAFVHVFQRHPDVAPVDLMEQIREGLRNQLAGAQWRKSFIPKLHRWLAEDMWQQRHDAVEVSEIISSKTQRTAASADAFLKGQAN